ncbi:GNAT family N-acetyltransferase [Evansella sp. LMS18]|uniref:GNAT family N-acetyltransferase n=1 Tax=Evansella sp. LMS18 TaxID=2924033 RepID=UPI0020D05204|nr:GNAT family N-acetyltransferase [Evansella sp. LMS18]UTR11049.1 GNAT family N-acetyltransferase [Evansella sp. LMS18]
MEVRLVTTEQELKDAYEVRKIVFVEEQNVPLEAEMDSHEKDSLHFVVYDEGENIGAGRFRILEGFGKVERICVHPSHRKKGVGEKLMRKIEETAKENGIAEIKLNAQTHAEAFYKKIGYTTHSDVFMDAGIPHVAMKKQIM